MMIDFIILGGRGLENITQVEGGWAKDDVISHILNMISRKNSYKLIKKYGFIIRKLIVYRVIVPDCKTCRCTVHVCAPIESNCF